VCDPPYGLSAEPDIGEVMRHWLAGTPYTHRGGGFMGKSWDSFVPGPDYWRHVLRVLKPGGHALVFAGTRTVDLMTVALRFAGFDIRDSVFWVYGSGFPKSLDVAKAIDKAKGHDTGPDQVSEAESGVYGDGVNNRRCGKCGKLAGGGEGNCGCPKAGPVSDEAKRWQGWGTALKPAHEPVIVARKPLGEGTVALNVLAHGTGALHIDACRVPGDNPSIARREEARRTGKAPGHPGEYGDLIVNRVTPERYMQERPGEAIGRWPANVMHDGSAEAEAAFAAAGELKPRGNAGPSTSSSGTGFAGGHNASGAEYNHDLPGAAGATAARFFYCAKASKSERDAGLAGREAGGGVRSNAPRASEEVKTRARLNTHPTVKPLELMKWLCRLATPPGGVVLDPFLGSGSTALAALAEGFRFVGRSDLLRVRGEDGALLAGERAASLGPDVVG
jgi:site-specific DNA-methyltransferase (adenine-specific)